MVTQETVQAVDTAIKSTETALANLSATVKKRVVELKAYPNEIVSRIQQTDGVLVEFEERK